MSEIIKNITGAGGGKTGGGGGGSIELPNSLRSRAMARGMDLLCEGPIEGLVNGKASIYVDDTPIVYIDENGNIHENFKGLTFDVRTGEPGQESIPGFDAIESETVVGVTLHKDDVGVTRSIAIEDIDAIRVTIAIPQLYFQDTSTGNTLWNSVDIQISTQEYGGAWVPRNITQEWISEGVTVLNNVASYDGEANGARLSIVSILPIAGATDNYQVGVVEFLIEYSFDQGVSWTLYSTTTVDSSMVRKDGQTVQEDDAPHNMVYSLIEVMGLAADHYKFRVRLGDGTTTFSGASRGASVLLGSAQFSKPNTIHTIVGKCMSTYERSFLIPVTGQSPFGINVKRTCPDSTMSNIVSTVIWKSYTTITYAKLRYPNCALVGMTVDSKQFDNIPVRGYDIKMLKVRIPSNYDPITRNYNGAWDGTFKAGLHWTDNPAWCYYDLLTHERYGLGRHIPESMVDKWQLYAIGQFCDGVDENGNFVGIPSGFGYNEPRFTLNVYIQTRFEAYKLLNDLTSVFRGMSYWAAGTIVTTIDSPTSATAVFNPSNVVDSQFVYTGSSKKARHTVVLVAWNNPVNLYKQEVEYVDDPEGILTFGVNIAEVTAVGCTSRGQARRVGKWLLYTEKYESEIITFRTGLDTAFLAPGSIFDVLDPKRSGIQSYGRLAGVSSNTVTLDRSVTLESGHSYFLTVMLADGTLRENITVTTGAGTTTTLTITPNFTTLPIVQGIWILVSDDIEPTKWRCVAINEVDPTTFEVVGVMHIAGKWAYIEEEEPLYIPPYTPYPDIIEPPRNVTLTEENMSSVQGYLGSRLVLSWEPPLSGFVTKFNAEHSDNYGNWTPYPDEDGNSRTLNNVPEGFYQARVCSVNALKVTSDWVTVSITTTGMPEVGPADVTGLALVGGGTQFHNREASFIWNPVLLTNASDYPEEDPTIPGSLRPWFRDYEVKMYDSSDVLLRTDYVTLESYTYTYNHNYIDTNGQPTRTFRICVVARDKWYRTSANPAVLTVTNPPPDKIETIQLEPFIGALNIYLPDPVTAPDFNHFVIYGSTVSAFIPSPNNVLYRGKAPGTFLNNIVGGWWYIIAAAVDDFGESELNYSDQWAIEVHSTPHSLLEQLTIPNIEEDPLYQLFVSDIAGEVGVSEIIDNLNNQYAVKITTDYEGGPYVAGFGLAAGPPDDPTASEFMVMADRFVVVNPNLPLDHAQVFTVHTINGVGAVGIDGSLIVDGTIHANSIVTNELVVGDGTGGTILMGPLARIEWAHLADVAYLIDNSVITPDVFGQHTYRLVSRGLSCVTAPLEASFWKNGALIGTHNRSYTFIKIRKSDGAVMSNTAYDVYASVANATALANALNATTSDYIVAIYTYDEPQTNRLAGGLEEAMYRCGASRTCFGSSNFKSRAAYALVGVAGCGEGNGAESYQGDVDSDSDAWCELVFTLYDGNITGVSSTYTPPSASWLDLADVPANLQGHFTTYIDAFGLYTGTVYTDKLLAGSALIGEALLGTASITTAKIADLNVTTLKIQDNAVIIPVGASSNTDFSVNSLTYIDTGISCTVTVEANVPVMVHCVAIGIVGEAQVGSTSSLFVRIIRDSTIIVGGDETCISYCYQPDALQGPRYDHQPACFVLKDVPGVGTHTYKLQARNVPYDAYNPSTLKRRGMTIMAVKK